MGLPLLAQHLLSSKHALPFKNPLIKSKGPRVLPPPPTLPRFGGGRRPPHLIFFNYHEGARLQPRRHSQQISLRWECAELYVMRGIQGIATFHIRQKFANRKPQCLSLLQYVGKHHKRSAKHTSVKAGVRRGGFLLFAIWGSYIILASEPT